MGGDFLAERDTKNSPFFMRRSIGRDYRKEIEEKLKTAKTPDEFRFIVTNFDNSLLKLAFLKAISAAEKMPKKVRISLPKRMRTLEGVELEKIENPVLECEYDPLEAIRGEIQIYARVEIPRAVHRCVDVGELAFYLEG